MVHVGLRIASEVGELSGLPSEANPQLLLAGVLTSQEPGRSQPLFSGYGSPLQQTINSSPACAGRINLPSIPLVINSETSGTHERRIPEP